LFNFVVAFAFLLLPSQSMYGLLIAALLQFVFASCTFKSSCIYLCAHFHDKQVSIIDWYIMYHGVMPVENILYYVTWSVTCFWQVCYLNWQSYLACLHKWCNCQKNYTSVIVTCHYTEWVEFNIPQRNKSQSMPFSNVLLIKSLLYWFWTMDFLTSLEIKWPKHFYSLTFIHFCVATTFWCSLKVDDVAVAPTLLAGISKGIWPVKNSAAAMSKVFLKRHFWVPGLLMVSVHTK